MDGTCTISSSKQENLPIINAQCCENLTPPKLVRVPVNIEPEPNARCNKSISAYNHWKYFKYYKRIFMAEVWIGTFIFCFVTIGLYLTMTSDEALRGASEIIESPPEKQAEPWNQEVIQRFFYQLNPELPTLPPEVYQNRVKRDTEMTVCQEIMELCQTVINSTWMIVSLVNSTMPHLQPLLKNFSTNTNESKSEFMELIRCLQCKNLIAHTKVSNSENDHRLHEHSDHKIKNNIDIVTNLLNGDKLDNEKQNPSSNYINHFNTEATHVKGNVETSTVSIFNNHQSEDMTEIAKEPGNSYQMIKTTEHESMFAEVKTSAPMTSETAEAVNQTIRIDDMEQPTTVLNVTAKVDGGNVTEIANDLMHPLVHPPDEGLAKQRKLKEDADNDTKSARNIVFPSSIEGRILEDNRIQPKGNLDATQGINPTAETIKSTQQLQLTPTMSWMPYQICFYGPQANGGAMKQSAPGQVIYPAASPGVPYPLSMPPQRQGPQNPVNQVPNYVQVQAQTVQFLPMQPNPGNPGLPANQAVGPTGPATQNLPIYPAFQPPPSGGPSASAKSPYYCTYIPAPTLQFPAIPGVSEYRRSAASSENNDTQGADKEGPFEPCPFNTIQCRNGQNCILRSQWCDGQVDCSDASDETSCSCRDRIAQERLCDGYFDCPHGEDELGCLGCSKTSFSCYDWSKRYTADNCVPLSQRCDGIKQCANGKDEIDCNILTPTYIEGKNVFTVGYTEGYLHKNYMGQWYPVCTTNDSWVRDACVSEIGPDMSGEPSTHIHSIPNNTYRGSYIADVEQEMKLVPSCMNTAIYVRCPQFPCGTRLSSHEDSLRPLVVENTFLQSNRMSRMSSENKTNTDKNGHATKGDDIVGTQLRVVGGRASLPKAWPFLVAIYKDGRFYCGGVILNEMWVLTAAHCLDGYTEHYYEIHAGLLRRLSFSPMAQSRKARQTVMYPKYSSRYMINDIGMIMLDEPLRFNRWVRPVCLPGNDILGSVWRLQPESNSTCLAIGWGAMTERGPDPDHLREVEVPILEKCKYETDQTAATICAGYLQGGRDACQGDSGGPLMCRNPYSESQWYVAGIVSHGEGCGRPNEPGAYTRVSYFLDWIQEITSGKAMPPMKRSPLEKCPGFSCEGGLGRCLPIESRCNLIVDCLDGEDEVNCRGRYEYFLYRQDNNTDPKSEIEHVTPVTIKVTTLPENFPTSDTTLPTANDHTSSVEEQNNNNLNSTTDSYTDTTTDSLPTSIEPVTTFTCTRLLQSISIDKRCNRAVDCEDSTDEVNCTCRDYLLNLKPTAVCDGYVDCDDQTDEKNCNICSENEFYCRNSRTCIAMSKKCDGKFDCTFKEDEYDCFALTNGRSVYLDADERPFLNMQGVLTRHVTGKWQPTCPSSKIYQNRSTITLIGKNMCEYFGFANLQSSDSMIMNNSPLKTIPWNRDGITLHGDPSMTLLNDKNKTCSGLYVHCRPVLSSSLSALLTVDAETGNRDYLWPWLAAIFVDGSYRCSAVLLDSNWLLSAAKCVENIRLDKNYTTAVLGYGPLYRYVDGPHQQVSMIDEVRYVNNSVSVLLHLKTQVNFTRHVRPLFLEKKIYPPGVNDTCIAIETNEDYQTKSVFLKPLLEGCQSCHRCFLDTFSIECLRNIPSNWSGTVFCLGKKGWYPAATFQNQNGPCNFKNTTLTSIDHINPYLMEAIDATRSPIEATCDGFRCNIGQCIPYDRVCDGVPDCRDQRDEDPKYCNQIREHCENSIEGCNCTRSQLRCNNGKCVDKSAFCDKKNDCTDASDEPSMCTCADYLKLTAPELLCDGVRHCLDKTDESPQYCPCTNSSFKCNTASSNVFCIPQDFICDGEKDCLDGEDEAMCRMVNQSLDGSAGTGEVIRRSYGVWHSECFSSPITSEKEASNLCKTMGYSSGTVNNNIMTTEDAMIPKVNDFYMVKLNDWKWMTLRDDKPLVTLVKPNNSCQRAFVTCT